MNRSVLLARLCRVPLTCEVIARLRRWEGRCLQWILGIGLEAGLSTQARSACLRRVRLIAARLGHFDGAWELLRRHFRMAGAWCRDSVLHHEDIAKSDFFAAFRHGLASSRTAARARGESRNSVGRFYAAWDQALDTWSGHEWLSWALDARGWIDREASWLNWAGKRWSVPSADVDMDTVVDRPPPTCRPESVDEPRTSLPALAFDANFVAAGGLHVFSDSEVLVRALQGRLRPREQSITDTVRELNDFMFSIRYGALIGPKYWWVTHVRRASNCAADRAANWARTNVVGPSRLVVYAPDVWESWGAELKCGAAV